MFCQNSQCFSLTGTVLIVLAILWYISQRNRNRKVLEAKLSESKELTIVLTRDVIPHSTYVHVKSKLEKHIGRIVLLPESKGFSVFSSFELFTLRDLGSKIQVECGLEALLYVDGEWPANYSAESTVWFPLEGLHDLYVVADLIDDPDEEMHSYRIYVTVYKNRYENEALHP